MRRAYAAIRTNILYVETLLRNFIKVKFGGPMLGLVIGTLTSESRFAKQLLVRSPEQNFIDIRRKISEIKRSTLT